MTLALSPVPSAPGMVRNVGPVVPTLAAVRAGVAAPAVGAIPISAQNSAVTSDNRVMRLGMGAPPAGCYSTETSWLLEGKVFVSQAQ
ncbi:hypothetical protein GXW83_08730 [Streptacidiphilus sp. PB12-B1b]|uniref:hypothetical protein n=1 Tax=Streptacidiphilus sp. PB12-B1b TaxID=2705012 RepID=UPI0015F97C8E|nr:hypothetical protein [Streptacidiphilus sp. PB12-B1b]QMU75814.1 hypothetical protein GXW83_08730 [Streptacidiphilus sp. PB12-B1b]